MNFPENIVLYYTTESKHGLYIGSLSGSVLIIASFVAWKFSIGTSMYRGLTLPLLIGGFLFLVGGFYAFHTARKEEGVKVELYNTSTSRFFSSEAKKVESIKKQWLPIQVFWSLILLAGIFIFYYTTKHYFTGVALGVLIIGVMGHIEEFISFQHNEKYRIEILSKFNQQIK